MRKDMVVRLGLLVLLLFALHTYANESLVAQALPVISDDTPAALNNEPTAVSTPVSDLPAATMDETPVTTPAGDPILPAASETPGAVPEAGSLAPAANDPPLAEPQLKVLKTRR